MQVGKFGWGCARSLAVSLVIVAVWGCSGSVRREDPGPGTGGAGGGLAGAGSAGTSGSAGTGTSGSAGTSGAGGIPTKEGVPIGDCTDPTDSEQAALGCPVQPPELNSSCSAPSEFMCRYPIAISNGMSWQTVFSCQAHSWGTGLQIPCGVLCGAPLAHVSELSGSCTDRTVTSCKAASAAVYAFPTDIQLLGEMLLQQIVACNGPSTGVNYQLEVTDGCPTRLSTDLALDATVSECLTGRLASIRWDCAERLSCVSYAQYLL